MSGFARPSGPDSAQFLIEQELAKVVVVVDASCVESASPIPTTTVPRGLPQTGSSTFGSTVRTALAAALAGAGLIGLTRRRQSHTK